MRTRLLVAVLSVVVCVVKGDKTITVQAQDPSVHYNAVPTDATNGNYSTWAVEGPSPSACSTPQMITERLGESMTFTFNGTGVSVIGTIGRKRGYLNFTLDGGPPVSFDRSNAAVVCDVAMFVRKGLPYAQHTVVATLVGEAIDYSNNVFDAILSVQRIQYFVPGSDSVPVGVIGGSVVGGIFFIALIVGVGLYLYRRSYRRTPGKGNSREPIDLDYEDKHPTPMMVATPFEWHGPVRPPSERRDSYGSPPSSRPSSQQALIRSSNNPYVPPASSSSGSDPKRESAPLMSQSNPDRTSIGSGAGDEGFVDRIAVRLADMMTGRGGLDRIVPPPVYDQGVAGPSRGAPVYENRRGGRHGPGQYPPEKRGAGPTPPSKSPSPEQEGHTFAQPWYARPHEYEGSRPPPR